MTDHRPTTPAPGPELRNGDLFEDVILTQERFEPASWSRPLDEQIRLLQDVHLPGIVVDADYQATRVKQPLAVHRVRVAVPKLAYLAHRLGQDDPFTRIGVLIEQVCELLDEQRQGKFTHYRKGQLLPNRIQVIPELTARRIALEESVPGDILILDVDLGNTYAGWTPRRARGQIIHSPDQLALTSVDIGWILLLNPDRFQCNTDLSVDSVAEEYFSEDRGWVTVLFYYYRGGKLEFGYRWNRRAYFDSGAAIATLGTEQPEGAEVATV
ncbi:MAG: hypothetical protein U0792_24060 [Gemmataceae bacterium]